jgi:hypothetical protein
LLGRSNSYFSQGHDLGLAAGRGGAPARRVTSDATIHNVLARHDRSHRSAPACVVPCVCPIGSGECAYNQTSAWFISKKKKTYQLATRVNMVSNLNSKYDNDELKSDYKHEKIRRTKTGLKKRNE